MKKLIKIAAVIFALCVFSACARKNKNGDIIFLANRNGMAATEDLRL